MTTGVPIYLVSACSSPEEFVAAFRRYVDRSGVFVPIAEPFSVGRRARLALTLVDGGVMIEGDAEVVAAATKPSALHGRIGMTIRFIEADAPSKLVIAEIEKARLIMKPPSSAVAPRPANLPDGPRPVPPPVGGRVDAANALAECVARGDLKPAVPAPIVETASGSVSKSGPKFVMPAIPGAPDSKATTLGVAPLSKPTTLGVAPLERPKGISGPIPMMGRRDPRLPLTPRVVPNAAGTPPLAVPNVSSRAPRATSEPPKSDEPTVGRTPTPTKPEPALGRTPTPTKPEPTPARTTSTHPEPEVSRTSTDPDVEPSVVVVHSPLPIEPETGVQTPVIARVTTPTTVEPPPSPPAEGRTSTRIDAVPPGPAEPIAHSRTATRLASVPPVVPALGSPLHPMAAIGTPTPEPEPPAPVVPEPSEPIVAKPAPLSEISGAPTVKSLPAFGVVSTEAPTEPSLARNETIRGMKPMILPARATQATPPPIPVATTKPMSSTVAPATVQSPIPTIDPDDVEIAEPTDLTEIPVVLERKTSLGLGAVGPDDGLGPVRDTTVMPAQKRPDAATRDVDAGTSPLDVEPPGDWTMKPDQSEPTPLSADAIAAARDVRTKQPSGDWTITPEPDSLDGWSDPGAVKPGPPKSEVASDVELDSARRPEPTLGGDEPKVQIDPTLIEPLPDLSDRAAASSSFPMGAGMTAVPVEAPPMPMPYGAPAIYPTPPPGSVMGPMYPTPVPYSQTFAPSATGPAQAIPGPEQQMAMLGFPPPQLVVQQSGTSGFFPYATDSSPRMTRAPRQRTRILVIAISAALVVATGIVVVVMLAGDSGGTATDAEVVQIEPEVAHGVQPTTPADADVAPVIQPAADAAAPSPAVKCYVDLTSAPDDAEIVLDKDRVAGRTPLKVELPCDSESTIVVRKHGYVSTAKTVTATASPHPVSVALIRAIYQLKVSSSPAGATITVNGKSGGVTPTIVKVAPFEPTTIVMTKDGFSTETEKLTPKTNNQTVHITLKRKKLR